MAREVGLYDHAQRDFQAIDSHRHQRIGGEKCVRHLRDLAGLFWTGYYVVITLLAH